MHRGEYRAAVLQGDELAVRLARPRDGHGVHRGLSAALVDGGPKVLKERKMGVFALSVQLFRYCRPAVHPAVADDAVVGVQAV